MGDWKPATRAVHGPDEPGEGDLALPVRRSSVFAHESVDHLKAVIAGSEAGWYYSRSGNPTVAAVERKLAHLEGASEAVLAGSGMGAITSTLLALTRSGARVVATADLYGTTLSFVRDTLPRFGVDVEIVPTGDVAAFERALREKPTTVAFVETPTNPLLRVLDLPRYARLAREAGAISVADTTFASPWNLRAMEHGVDVVVASATKFLGGHSDLTLGYAAVRSPDLARRVRAQAVQLGPVADPAAAFLLDRGTKTLGVRLEKQNANALALARALEARSDVARVLHPMLASHPDHKVASSLLRGLALVTFDIGTLDRASRVVDALRLAKNAPSLGGVETTVSQAVISSHRGQPLDALAASGITPGTIRVSVGIEDVDDIVGDFERALDAAR